MTQRLSINGPVPAIPATSARFSPQEQLVMRREFAIRLKIAFDNASNAEIARRLKTTDATIKCYTDAERLPVYEILVQIGRVTGVNLNWLLTGNGPTRVEPIGSALNDREESEIRKLAAADGRTFEEQVRVLLSAAMEFKSRVG